MSKTFSVIVPLYNCEDYIEECIQSITNQIYKDIEIIIVNDGSTDRSLSVVKGIQDDRIKIVNQENKGLFHARISGLKVATGDVCLFVDADDLIQENTLNSIGTYFDEGYDCVIYKLASFYGKNSYAMIEENGVFNDETIFDSKNRKELLTTLLTTGKVNSIVCKAFRRELVDVKKLSTYPRIAIGEDALFTLEVFENMASAIYLNHSLYLYRQQAESMTHKLTVNIYFDNVYRFKMYREISEKYYVGSELETIKKDIDRVTFKMITSMALNKRYEVKDYSTFCKIFKEVACDTYYREICERAFKEQKILFRYVIEKICNQKFSVIYRIRKLVECFSNIFGKVF